MTSYPTEADDYDDGTMPRQRRTRRGGRVMLELRGGPSDGRTITTPTDCVRIHVLVWVGDHFVRHAYDARSGEWLGGEWTDRDIAALWGPRAPQIDPDGRWNRMAAPGHLTFPGWHPRWAAYDPPVDLRLTLFPRLDKAQRIGREIRYRLGAAWHALTTTEDTDR